MVALAARTHHSSAASLGTNRSCAYKSTPLDLSFGIDENFGKQHPRTRKRDERSYQTEQNETKRKKMKT